VTGLLGVVGFALTWGFALALGLVELRERTLWRLLDETAARADEVLRLDVEDLDIPANRARTRFRGGDVDWLFFGSGSARLPRLIAGRRAGPVFLSSLRPSPARARPPATSAR